MFGWPCPFSKRYKSRGAFPWLLEMMFRFSEKYARVLRFVTHYWWLSPRLFCVLLIARVASTLVDVSVPVASGRFVDAIASGSRANPAPAAWALALLLGLAGLFQISRQTVGFLLNRVSARAITAIGRDAFAKVQRFSAEWHANSFAGSTVRKITRGMSSFDNFTDTLALNLAPALVVVIGVTATFIWRWPILGVAVGLCVTAFIAVTVSLSIFYVSPANRAAREWDSRMSGILADSVTGNATVKTFAAEEREDSLFSEVARNWGEKSIVSWDRSVLSGLAQAGMLLLLQAMMLGVGVWLWNQGLATPGDIASLIATQFLLSGYLSGIGQQVRTVQRAINDMDDVLEFREAEPDVADRPGALDLRPGRGRIVFDHVTFRYKSARKPVFDTLSLEIPAGQRVGLVGASGAGKSTFVKLIQRFYDIESGTIAIDGQNIAGVTQASLRQSIGLVPQDPILFHRSLADNIAYGRPGASFDAVRRAAELAHAAEFIEGLSKGYDTLVGERGVKLSGGERQRVAIARAILADTPILVLDEATSSLDSVSERYIRAAIERLSSGRTTLVVAHRLSTIQALDRILVFDHGKIIEDGVHADLMARPDGAYRRLLEAQIGAGEIEVAA